MAKFNIGVKVYYLSNAKEWGVIKEYKEEDGTYHIEQHDGTYLWTPAYSWTSSFVCYHTYKKYWGFTEKYQYCETCDHKRDYDSK